MTRRIVVAALLLVFAVSGALALSKTELKQTYNEMTVDDLKDLQDISYRIMNDSARQTGYAKADVAVGGAGGFYYFLPNASINDNKPALAPSISALYGGGGGFLVNLNPNLALGGLFGGMGGGSTTKVGASYYSYTVGGAFELVHAQYKPVINDNFIIGIDLGLGQAQGGYNIDTTDENMTGQDISRAGSSLAYLLGIDIRKRIVNTFFLSGKLGIFSASIETLKRGDYTDPGKKLVLSAPYLALGLGGNF